jgi:hypothetical protein
MRAPADQLQDNTNRRPTEIQDERRQPKSFKTPKAAICKRVERKTQRTSDATSAQTVRVRQANVSRRATRRRMKITRPLRMQKLKIRDKHDAWTRRGEAGCDATKRHDRRPTVERRLKTCSYNETDRSTKPDGQDAHEGPVSVSTSSNIAK